MNINDGGYCERAERETGDSSAVSRYTMWATYTKIECNELAMYTTEVNIYSVVYFVRFSRDVAGIMRG